MQLEIMNQMMITNHDLNGKDIEVTTLKLQNEQLRNELRRAKEFAESFDKSSEEGESSKSGEKRNYKGKNYKPTCYNCGKLGHATNVCRSNNANQNPK